MAKSKGRDQPAARRSRAKLRDRRVSAPAKSVDAASVPDAVDVLVIGGHPSAYLASAVVAGGEGERPTLLQVIPPGEHYDDRLLPANPRLLSVGPPSMAQKLRDLREAAGLCFLSESAGVRGTFVAPKQPAVLIASMSSTSASLAQLADEAGVHRLAPRAFAIERVVDHGVQVALDDRKVIARAVLLGWGGLPQGQQRILGLAGAWEPGVVRGCGICWFKPPAGAVVFPADRTIAMSLDLMGSGAWAWLIDGGGGDVQLSIQGPSRSAGGIHRERLLAGWVDLLATHGLVRDRVGVFELARSAVRWNEVPVAGALSSETVANRTLLFGPAGGFYSTCGEELYPACWSAVSAATVAVRSLAARHLQDALQSYRAEWGSTLGDYLRGPQQNLTLLLPLIYRNAVMSARVGEAILFGESVVR